ncbi:serine incorporator/TMS membrane protein [Lipomyces japonicus]|uniref:serine incorporator/TMS membrane protein n=1 Tax=Lipomyces japonicus TaxID=56871 RepID=UPI0034CFC948
MGAALSLPLLALPAFSTAGSYLISCCGAAACTTLFSACGKCSSSLATRIAYALIFIANSILSWVMLTPWVLKKLESISRDYVGFRCFGSECTGFVAVHRIQFALAMLHLILGLVLIGVHSTRNKRSDIQDGYWGPKILAWLLFIVVSFLIPDGFFVFWGNYVSIIGAFIFIIYGLILLVDFAHSWAEMCLNKIETYDSKTWRSILIGSTLGMYVASLVITIIMYVFFANGGCSMNQAAITVNLLLTIIVSAVSVNPTVQEYNPQAGLAQSAIVSIYCTYLTMTAVAGEPDDRQCNPLIRSRGTRTASVVLGAIFTFLAIAYTTIRAASRSSSSGQVGNSGDDHYGYQPVSQAITSQPLSRQSMRQDAIRAAVDSGSLPQSALYDLDDESDDGAEGSAQSEYNYSVFHFIFVLATQWTATLLTMQVNKDDDYGFVPVGRTYFYTWVKIVSAWICFALYTWTLVAPVVAPHRFGHY